VHAGAVDSEVQSTAVATAVAHVGASLATLLHTAAAAADTSDSAYTDMFDQTGTTTATTTSSANWQQRWCRAVSLTAHAALNCEHVILLLHERTSATDSTDGYGSSDDADAVTSRVYSPRSPQRQRIQQQSPHRATAANTDRRSGVHRVSTASSFVCYDWSGNSSSSSSGSAVARCAAAFGYMADVVDIAAAAVPDDEQQQQQQQQFIARGATPYDELLPKVVRSSLGLEGDSARYATD
jgi:hypothetical protein